MIVREVIWPILFKVIDAQAITLYPFIFYESEQARRKYQAHEFVHVEQVRRLGWLRFYAEYLYQNIRYGYDKNLFEIEARERTGVK